MTQEAPATTSTKKALYVPRKQFLPFHNRTERWSVIICHRRSGKTVASINDLIVWAEHTKKKDAQFFYVAPTIKQAKRIAWTYLVRYSKYNQKRVNEAELYVELKNGARIYVFGADDPDSARGMYFMGGVIDEAAQVKRAFISEVIRPALADHKGWLVIMGTPKGKNNILYEYYQKALASPNRWFHMTLKASESGLIGPKELADIKEDMNDSEYQQEFECSFEAALVGSIYGKNMANIQRAGKIVNDNLYNPAYPVSLSIDIGRRDETAIWFWQIICGQVRFIEYWQTAGTDAQEVCEMLRNKPYSYNFVYLPHDAFHKTFASKKSTFDTFVEYFDQKIRRVPNPDMGNSVKNGIDAVRKFLRTFPFRISEPACRTGIEALKNYSHEWQEKLKQFVDRPKHDKYSHGADAFRYAALSIQWEDIQRSAEELRERSISPQKESSEQKDERINTFITQRIEKPKTLNDLLRAHDRRLTLMRTGRRARI